MKMFYEYTVNEQEIIKQKAEVLWTQEISDLIATLLKGSSPRWHTEFWFTLAGYVVTDVLDLDDDLAQDVNLTFYRDGIVIFLKLVDDYLIDGDIIPMALVSDIIHMCIAMKTYDWWVTKIRASLQEKHTPYSSLVIAVTTAYNFVVE